MTSSTTSTAYQAGALASGANSRRRPSALSLRTNPEWWQRAQAYTKQATQGCHLPLGDLIREIRALFNPFTQMLAEGKLDEFFWEATAAQILFFVQTAAGMVHELHRRHPEGTLNHLSLRLPFIDEVLRYLANLQPSYFTSAIDRKRFDYHLSCLLKDRNLDLSSRSDASIFPPRRSSDFPTPIRDPLLVPASMAVSPPSETQLMTVGTSAMASGAMPASLGLYGRENPRMRITSEEANLLAIHPNTSTSPTSHPLVNPGRMWNPAFEERAPSDDGYLRAITFQRM